MGRQLRIEPMLDLVGLVSNYGRTLKGVDLIVKPLDKVAAPYRYSNQGIGTNIVWRKVGLICARIHKDVVISNCKNVNTMGYIDNLEDFMYLNGLAIAALPENTAGNVILSRCNIEITDKSLVAVRWSKVEDTFVISPCETSTLDSVYLPDSVSTVLHNVNTIGMNELFKRGVFEADTIPRALIGSVTRSTFPVIVPATCAEVTRDKEIVSATRASDLVQINNSAVPISLGLQANGAFGVSSSPVAVATPTIKRVQPAQVVSYDRKVFKDNATFDKDIQAKLADCAVHLDLMLATIRCATTKGFDPLRKQIFSALSLHFYSKPKTNYGDTGFVLMRELLTQLASYKLEIKSKDIEEYNYRCTLCGDAPITISEETINKYKTYNYKDWVAEYIKDKSKLQRLTEYLHTGVVTQYDYLGDVLLCNIDKVLISIISIILNLKCDLCAYCNENDIISIIFQNPYNLTFLIDNIHIADLDKLAMLTGLFDTSDCRSTRCIAYYHNQMVMGEGVINNRTCVSKRELKKILYGVSVTEALNKRLQLSSTGKPIYLTSYVATNVECYLNNITTLTNFELDMPMHLDSSTHAIVYTLGNTSDAVDMYIMSSVGVQVMVDNDECIMDYYVLRKEVGINLLCKNLYDAETKQLPPELIEHYTESFEKTHGFTLEEKQKASLYGLNSGVMILSGSAGTGKTTTVQAMLFLLTEGFGYDPKNITLLAPTGRASARIKSMTGHKAHTIARELIASQYHIKANVVIVDECSMISLDTMYALISAIEEGTKVIFIGDIAQLPPIGLGKPFANMLNYLPCVTLSVSKRATSKSNITKNANSFIDITNTDDFVQGDDFEIIPCDTMNVTAKIAEILTNTSYDLKDIQIVSPMKKQDLIWGTYKLNLALRSVFNPNRNGASIKYLMNGTERVLNIGDRVVHLKNHADCPRLIYDNGNYSISVDSGIMNGDVGYIKDIIPSDKLSTLSALDLTLNDGNCCYMLVEYEDADGKFLIAYRCRYLKTANDTTPLNNNGVYWVESADLAEVDLAYALTVHKLQGSQSKMIIFPIYPTYAGSSFISNNLVYTAITRASDKVVVIGDYNAIRNAKAITILKYRTSIYDKY